MIEAHGSKHFSIGLPKEDPDQTLAALFRHVAQALEHSDPIGMHELLAIGFNTELGDDAVHRGYFTIVFSPDD